MNNNNAIWCADGICRVPINSTFDSIPLRGKNTIRLGQGISNKEVNAGVIGYQTFSNSLDIVGAGNKNGNRQVQIWDHLNVPGSITVNNMNVKGEITKLFENSRDAFTAIDNVKQKFDQLVQSYNHTMDYVKELEQKSKQDTNKKIEELKENMHIIYEKIRETEDNTRKLFDLHEVMTVDKQNTNNRINNIKNAIDNINERLARKGI